jgi:hypothetical protein
VVPHPVNPEKVAYQVPFSWATVMGFAAGDCAPPNGTVASTSARTEAKARIWIGRWKFIVILLFIFGGYNWFFLFTMGSKSLWDAARFNLALYQGDATAPSCDFTKTSCYL